MGKPSLKLSGPPPKAPDRERGRYLIFFGLSQLVQGIQGIALDDLWEKLIECLLMAKALQPGYLAVYGQERPDLAVIIPLLAMKVSAGRLQA
ncbi:MAG: hypothetical protein Q7V48_02110 [Deltaproteobacteria bacterium]|nr:hypothetical protein [Deltaproteobacteria bacterium]MDO9209532.1 hypothetical protein [Deltaproteobacteria bacterium]